MNGYDYLLNIKYKNCFLSLISLIITVITLILSCFLFTYDKYTTIGIWQNDSIIIDIPVNNSDAVVKGKFIKIDKTNYLYNIKSISKLEKDNYLNYQTYEIDVSQKFLNNQIINITFYYRKQRIIQKIIKIIF